MKAAHAYRFRLYVTGIAPNSVRAVANLTAFCNHHLPDGHEIEIVDLERVPARALTDGVFLTPTLVRFVPGPEVRVIGSLSEAAPLLTAFGMRKG